MYFSGRKLADILAEEGLLPPATRTVELFMPPDGALTLRYEIFLTDDRLRQLATALQRIADEAGPPIETRQYP